jgi:anti-anti-sigma factor
MPLITAILDIRTVMLLTITTRVAEPDILVVEIEGRILLGRECTHVEDTVVKAIDDGARNIVVDLAGVRQIDSSGLGIITLCFGKMSKAGGRFYLAGAHGVVLEILKMTHLDSVIPCSPTAEEACARMATEIRPRGAAAGAETQS